MQPGCCATPARGPESRGSLAREDRLGRFRFFGLLVGNGQFCGHDTAARVQGHAALRGPRQRTVCARRGGHGGFHLNGSGGAWHGIRPTGLGQQAKSGCLARSFGCAAGDRGSRLPAEANGLAGARMDAHGASQRRFRTPCLPSARRAAEVTKPRDSRKVRPEWQLTAGAEPVPGAIPARARSRRLHGHPQRRGLRWLAKPRFFLSISYFLILICDVWHTRPRVCKLKPV